jgi:hypothetical protein
MQVKTNPEGIGRCGCGRSPTGYCIGWHGLDEQALAEARERWAREHADVIESEGGETD